MGRETLAEDDPQSIGSYWLTARLGAGGQGIVYEAYDAAGTRCAVKVLRTQSASRSSVQQRFAKEVAAAERVASFCTAKVLDSDPRAEPPYMVSEFVGGPDLGAAVAASGPMAGDALLRLVTGVATALTAIHGAGVVHRDLKPANVLLGPDGPRVIDFGIARTQDMSLTATGEVMGTPAYMAPEVLRGERADDRADVFAWGAITLFAATGSSPFLGRTPSETIVRVTEHQPELEPLPVPLRPLVEAALSKDPGGRPTSSELLLGLLSAEGSAFGPAEGEASDELLAAGARSAAQVRAPADSPPAVPELGTLAESVYGGLSAPEREFAQAALLRLVVPGEAGDGSQDTVRTAARDELLLRLPLDERPVGQSVLDKLVAAGLLLDEGHRVRPAGAGLLRAWPRLRDWVDEHRAALRVMQRTGVAARAWERGARDPEDLPRGDALRTALEWAADAPGAVRPNSLEREYLDAGRTAVTRAVRRRHRRRAGVAALVVAVLAVGTVAWQLQRSNNEQEAEAASREVATAAESMRSSDPRTAKLLSAAAWRLAPTHEARTALYGTAWQAESDIRTNPAASTGALSADGTTLVSFNEGERQNRVLRWDARTGKTLSTGTRSLDIPDSGEAADPVVSPEGRFAAHTNTRGGDRATVRDLESGGKLTDRAPGTPMALSKGGRHVLGQSAGGGELRVYDTREETTVLSVPFSDAPTAFSDDGSVLAVCQPKRSPTLYWPGSGKKRALKEGDCGTAPEPVDPEDPEVPVSLDLSPDGERLVLSDSQQPDDHEDLVQWRTATGESLAGGDRVFLEDVGDPVPRTSNLREGIDEQEDATFYGSDGRTLVHTTEDAIRVTDPSTPDRALLKVADSGHKQGVSFDPSSRQLRSLTQEEIRSFPVPKVPSRFRGASDQGIFSPDAGTLLLQEASAEDPSKLDWRAWDAERGKRRAQPVLRQDPQVRTIKPGFGPSVAFHPDGGEVSYGTDKRTVRQDTRTGEVAELPGDSPQRAAATLAYGPEGRVLAVSHHRAKPYTEVWREGRDTPRVLKGVGMGDVAVGGSAGHEVLVTSEGHFVDLRTGERRTRVFGRAQVGNVEFSPDGKTLAASQEDGWIQLWNSDVTRRLGGMPSEEAEQRGLEQEQFSADRLRFSPDGRTLAARVGEERVQLFDVPGRKPLGAAHPGFGGKVLDLAFDGNDRLRLATESVRLDSVDIDPDRLADRVCDSAERGLTRAQWERHVPDGVSYREVCD